MRDKTLLDRARIDILQAESALKNVEKEDTNV